MSTVTGPVGISSWAYVWRGHPDRGEAALTPVDMIVDAARLGAEVFQLCDHPALVRRDPGELADIVATTDDLGLALEIGSRGITPRHLLDLLDLAQQMGARLVRTMTHTPESHPANLAEATAWLETATEAYANAGVTLGLESYEQIATADLVTLVTRVDDPHLGIVLDPGNAVGRLERPADVVAACAPHVVNLHVKDFAFSRLNGGVGFRFAGARLGEGLLDLHAVLTALRGHDRAVSHVIEHWLPLDTGPGALEATAALETEWVGHSVAHLQALSVDARLAGAHS